ncbi:MAG TPA: hypothetical protein ENJ11_10505 [Gammaproteobacteria bacterium]|nr:hypothetical protein [Gammaproteobacteria bacterium]
MHANLSLQQAPPFSVPARFLVSAPVFGLLAALVLLWHGPDIISSRWNPPMLAVTHLLTLGFLAMSMLGAMLQLMPVLMGMVIPRPVLFSSIIHTPLVLGSLSLAAAWLLQYRWLFLVAMLLLGFTFAVFVMVAAERLLRSVSRHITRTMMLLALLALLLTAGLGIYLAAGYVGETFAVARQLTDLHLSWGLLGWVFMLVMAVAYQVIPMFQITDDYPKWHQRWLGWLLFVLLLALSLTWFYPLAGLQALLGVLLAACLLVFALNTLWLLHRRRRTLPDTTMKFWQLAMASLIALVFIRGIAMLAGIELPALLTGVLMIAGFAMTAVNGMMYKIIPFLIWLHLSARNKDLRDAGRREQQVKVPHMRKIIPENAGLWQFRIHFAALVLLALATCWPAWFFYPAVLLFALAQGFLLYNLLNAVRFYGAKRTALQAVL